MAHFKIIGLSLAVITLLGVGVFLEPGLASKKSNPLITENSNLVDGQWEYMPGVLRKDKGLLVKSLQYSLVGQKGIFSQSNPPINLAGTYIDDIRGDFQISAKINLQDSKAATLQFYGRVPIIADEFRVERESVRITIKSGNMTVSVWSKDGQSPTATKSFDFIANDTINLRMSRIRDILQFSINDKILGSVPESEIFNSKQIWFGLDSDNGTWLLSNLKAEKINGGNFKIADSSISQITGHDTNGIQVLASKKRPGFIVGVARAIGPSFTDPEYRQIAFDKNIFGSMTPENEMKMINIQPQPGLFAFEKADGLVSLAKQNGISVHGHTLVFGEANPPWFNALPVENAADKQKIETIMIDYINTVVKHFGSDVNSWDVINEPMADYDDTADGEGAQLRQHKWYQAMGESYISKAIETAHNANPDAMLFVNEYGLEADGVRWDAFINLMQRLKIKLEADNIPTNKIGVGFQAHVYEAGDRIAPVVLRRHIRQLEKLGFKMQISEIDVYSDDGVTIQTQQYTDIFKTCMEESNCIAWRGWILSDRYDYFKDDDGQIYTGEDGLYDVSLKPRPALSSIQKYLLQ